MKENANKAKPTRNVLGRGLSSLMSRPVPVSLMDPQKPATSPFVGNAAFQTINTSTETTPLLVQTENEKVPEGISYLKVDLISRNSSQPRQLFNEEELKELSDSIRKQGVIQPVIVRPKEGGKFEIVAGERRWRAAKLAELSQLPVIIKNLSDKDTLEIALIENIQRSNLNPIEEATAYQRLVDEHQLSQQEIAESVGKDRATISNYLRLLKLPTEVIKLLSESRITIGHAKALLSLKDSSAQVRLAKKSVEEGISVRELETLASQAMVLEGQSQAALKGKGTARSHPIRTIFFPEVVDRMRNALGTKVIIKHQKSGRGKIEIQYFSEQELDRLVEKICSK